MKRLLLSLAIMCGLALLTAAQQKTSPFAGLGAISFYGVDFSKGRIYGSVDEPQKLRTAYADINMLFITEPEKYNVAKYTGKPMNEVRPDAVTNMNDTIPDDSLKTFEKTHVISDADIEQTLKGLNIVRGSGLGLVMIMQYLDKPAEKGTFVFVLFNVEERTIVRRWTMTGTPGGFGLRNYWAHAILDVLSKVKTYKD